MIVLDSVDSTNNYLKQKVAESKNYDSVISKSQSSGRGRLNRKWDSGIKGNLYLSFILKETKWLNIASHLSIMVPVAVRRSITGFISNDYIIKLKWPNDLFTDKGKLGGILIDAIGNDFIIGIGVNVVDAPKIENLKTSCICDFIELRDFKIEILANDIIDKFQKIESEYSKFGFDKIKDEWLKYCIHRDKEIFINDNEKVVFTGLGKNGEAKVKDKLGAERSIFYGDIGLFLP